MGSGVPRGFVVMAKVEGCDGGQREFGNGVDGLAESSETVDGEAVGSLRDVHCGDDRAEMLRGVESVGDVIEKETEGMVGDGRVGDGDAGGADAAA